MEKIFIIGRNPSVKGNEIPIPISDPYNNVSANHCKISFNGSRFTIEDLNSSNGTFVNGQQILTKTELDSNQTILLGSNYVLNLNSNEFQKHLTPKTDLLNELSYNTNPNFINKVVDVPLKGGIIGFFSGSPIIQLNKRLKIENSNGWKVVQLTTSTNADIFLVLLRTIILFITLFLYTTKDGYFIVFEKEN